MNAWLRIINLDTWTSSPLEVSGELTLMGGCRLTRAGDRWVVSQPRSASGVLMVHDRHVLSHELTHGDAFTIGSMMHVFLTRPIAEDHALVRNLDEKPDDHSAVKVWADWLLEHGDPLGEHLLGAEPQPWVLEGVQTSALELTWDHGLLTAAKIRCTPTSANPIETLARLSSTRVSRWLRELVVDCSTWDGTVFDTQRNLGTALRLLMASNLTALRRLGFGVITEAFDPPGLFVHLKSRLTSRFTKLERSVDAMFLPTPYPTLEIAHIPEGLDFHAPHARERRLALTNGAWVGSSSPGQLRLLTQGVHRGGVMERFLIEAERLSLFPVDEVLLNGHRATQTRLLDGDVIETSDGARFRFRA